MAGTIVTCSGNTLTFAAGSDTSEHYSPVAVDDELVEWGENIVLYFSDASLDSGGAVIAMGSAALSSGILEQGAESSPTDLFCIAAGSKIVIGEQLYGIDLEKGETRCVGEFLVNGTSSSPNTVGVCR
jgi:hypothetical protein